MLSLYVVSNKKYLFNDYSVKLYKETGDHWDDIILNKLDSEARLVSEPPLWISTTRQTPPVCNPPTYLVVTIVLIMTFFNRFMFGFFLGKVKLFMKTYLALPI